MRELSWEEQDQGEYSIFRYGQYTLEPEDLDIDQWSLWWGEDNVFNGTETACRSHAESNI